MGLTSADYRNNPVQHPALANVEGAATKASSALDELTAAIREARQAGLSLRAIAEAAGWSHETVRKVGT